jgi:defect-in-organelle-trafficking protein DotD
MNMQKMDKMYAKTIICIILGCNLLGCSSALRKNTDANSSKVAFNTVVEQELVASARTIENALALLARTQEEHNVPLLNTAPLITPEGGMSGTADIDWTGPIEPLVRKLADMTDYKVKVLGIAPTIPIIVSISQDQAIIADILKNAGMQAGKRANIVVFPANRVIEVRYAKM